MKFRYGDEVKVITNDFYNSARGLVYECRYASTAQFSGELEPNAYLVKLPLGEPRWFLEYELDRMEIS